MDKSESPDPEEEEAMDLAEVDFEGDKYVGYGLDKSLSRVLVVDKREVSG